MDGNDRPRVASTHHYSSPATWYTTERFRSVALWTILVIVLVQGYIGIFKRKNDFLWHYHLGQAFLAGDPYQSGGDWYPLPRAMMDAAPALLNIYVARTICYALAIAALYACFRIWKRLAEAYCPATPAVTVAAAVFTIALFVAYLLRDLDECGLQIFLLFFLSVAADALHRGKAMQTGFWLATAAAYKATPLLFLPVLVWKRQWKAAGFMTLFLALWCLSPAVPLGWQNSIRAHGQWLARTQGIMAARNAYPSLPGAELPKPHNQSLQAAIARYLETHPADHPLYLKHAAFHQFGNLPPETAYTVVKGSLLILACLFAWRVRRRWGSESGQAPLAPEWAALCLLCALLAPLCWKQHLVLGLPCLFLAIRSTLAMEKPSRWRIGVLAVAGAIALLSRHFVVGREFSVVLLSYKLDTLAVALPMLLTLSYRRRDAANAGAAPESASQSRPYPQAA